MITQIVH